MNPIRCAVPPISNLSAPPVVRSTDCHLRRGAAWCGTGWRGAGGCGTGVSPVRGGRDAGLPGKPPGDVTRFPTQDAGFVRLAAPPARPLWWTLLAALSFAAAGCSNPSSTPTTGKSPPPERPVVQTRSARTPPAAPKQEAPPTRPADTLPPSRYESRPPYPVDLHVRTPDDPQPGWLRILELAETNRPAELHGKFPEQNLMVVDSQNVRRLDIHIGHLPLAQGKRIFLRIDGQGIELRRGKGDFITFERSPAGVWNRVADH